MSRPIDLRQAGPADLPLVADVLADAFHQDPVLSWLIPPTSRQRDLRLQYLWRVITRGYFRRRRGVYLTADGHGAALWSPPGRWRSSTVDEIRDSLPTVPLLGPGLRRATNLHSHLAPLHAARPAHWYLFAIGTRRQVQGQGYGGALLAQTLEAVDADGSPAYLESTNERNLPLYERHGFAVVDQVTVADGPPIWLMWRTGARP